MSKDLEPLLAIKESKNKPTKYRGARDDNADWWMMLLDNAWTIIEYLEHEARYYISNKSEEEKDTRKSSRYKHAGTGSSTIHIQQRFRTRYQNSEEDYMQYLDAIEGLRSQVNCGAPPAQTTITWHLNNNSSPCKPTSHRTRSR